jgi:hypothetical protein
MNDVKFQWVLKDPKTLQSVFDAIQVAGFGKKDNVCPMHLIYHILMLLPEGKYSIKIR